MGNNADGNVIGSIDSGGVATTINLSKSTYNHRHTRLKLHLQINIFHGRLAFHFTPTMANSKYFYVTDVKELAVCRLRGQSVVGVLKGY